jgi:prevent-host-death family protein
MYMTESIDRISVGVAELRQNLSVFLRRVEKGERLVVTDRNRPVAVLAPLNTSSRLDQLIAEGRVSAPRRTGPLPPPLENTSGDPHGLSRALAELRDEEER